MPGDQSICTHVHGVPVKYRTYPSNNLCDEKLSTKYGESENHNCYSHMMDNWNMKEFVCKFSTFNMTVLYTVHTYVTIVPKPQWCIPIPFFSSFI